MEPDRYLEVIEAAREQFVTRLKDHHLVRMTLQEYCGGVNALSAELRRISAEISREIYARYGQQLTHNQASIALISAMNGLGLIEVVA